MHPLRHYLLGLFLLLIGTTLQAQEIWKPVGTAINGQSNENLGGAISLSADGNIMAIGSTGANSSTGAVRVYQRSGNNWVLMGTTLNGLGTSDNFGSSVSLSADGLTLAVGARTSDEGFPEFSTAGYVKVFTWSGSAWVQKGAMLSAVEASEFFGNSVSLSADGTFLAVGAPNYNGAESSLGTVRVYEWNGTSWSKIGSDIIGTANAENFGTVVSISVTGNDKVLAVSSPFYESVNGSFDVAGKVSIFRESDGSWSGSWTNPQVIVGNPDDNLGLGLALSGDGNRLAIGAPKNEFGFSSLQGFVQVYEYQSTAWVQLGSNLTAQTDAGEPIEFDSFGKSVALSNDGNSIIIGAPVDIADLSPTGRAEVYSWDGNDWLPVSDDIVGLTEFSSTGAAVAMSADASLVAVGAPNGDGSVRAFTLGLPDLEGPIVQLSANKTAIKDDTPFELTITFNEPVLDFNIGDITVTNGNVTALGPAGIENTYLATIVSTAEADLTIQILENALTDEAGNGNSASAVLTIIFDNVAPTIELVGSLIGEAPYTFSITFSEPVVSFTEAQVLIINGSKQNFSGSGLEYSVEVIPTTGDLAIGIVEETVFDEAGNGNEAAYLFFDRTAPNVTISSSAETINNLVKIPITLTFNEEVKDFTDEVITVTNGTPSNVVRDSDRVFTAEISPLADGELSISLAANVVEDLAGNGNNASNTFTITSDRTGPTVQFAQLPAFNNGSSFTGLLIFNESIGAGSLTLADIQVSNASITNLEGPNQLGNSFVANFTVQPTGAGDMVFTVPAEAVTDALGNLSSAAESVTVILDNVAPTVVVNAPATVLGTQAFEVSFQFSEKVSGFVAADVEIVGGALGELSTEDEINFSGSLTPSVNAASISISVPAQVAQDLALNFNTASAMVTVEVDVPPTITILNAPAARNATPFTITVQFSEPVDDFSLADISLINATGSDFNGSGATYTALVTPSGAGDITISIAANVATDAGGNGNLAAEPVTVTFDNVAPVLTITGAPADVLRFIEPITLTFTFSEAVTGFTIDDIAVTNATKANFTSTSASVYTATLTPINEGNFTASVAANAATDAAGNGNNAVSVSMTYDRKYSGGTGTAADPYLIANEADLRELSASTADYSAHFKQTADIKMGAEAFTPIGQEMNRFKGTYDGSGFVIDGLSNINPSSINEVSLFGDVENAVLKNMGITSLNINTDKGFSGIVTRSFGLTMSNCYVTGNVSSTASVAGLVGYAFENEFIVENSFTDINISGFYTSGLVASITSSVDNAIIRNSYSLSSLDSRAITNTPHVQGALINSLHTANASVENTYFAGAAKSPSVAMYGIVAVFILSLDIVKNSFWDKELTGIEGAFGGGTPLTTTQLKTLETFTDAGWDFTNTWHFPFNYPVLKWQVDRMREFTISGKVIDQNGNAFTAGSVTAYVFGGESKTVRLDAQGRYTLDLPKGFYSLYVTPDTDAQLVTFYGNTNNLFKAKLIFYNHSGVDVKMIAKSQINLLDGNGRVSGKVVSRAGGGNRIIQGRVASGDPLAGVSVMLIRVSDEQVMTTVITDANGDFEITGIPAGEYKLVVFIAGIATDLSNNTLRFEEGGTDLVVSALVSEDGVELTIESVLGLADQIPVKFYPNPARNFVNIEVSGEVTLKVYNLTGVVIIEQTVTNSTVLDVTGLKAGIHLIEISNASGRTVRKLLKSN